MKKKTKVPNAQGGRPPIFPFKTLLIGEGHFVKDAEDKLRNAVSQYAARHDITLVCRATYDKNLKKIGITVYRKAHKKKNEKAK